MFQVMQYNRKFDSWWNRIWRWLEFRASQFHFLNQTICGDLGTGTTAFSIQNPAGVEIAKFWNSTAKSTNLLGELAVDGVTNLLGEVAVQGATTLIDDLNHQGAAIYLSI